MSKFHNKWRTFIEINIDRLLLTSEFDSTTATFERLFRAYVFVCVRANLMAARSTSVRTHIISQPIIIAEGDYDERWMGF